MYLSLAVLTGPIFIFFLDLIYLTTNITTTIATTDRMIIATNSPLQRMFSSRVFEFWQMHFSEVLSASHGFVDFPIWDATANMKLVWEKERNHCKYTWFNYEQGTSFFRVPYNLHVSFLCLREHFKNRFFEVLSLDKYLSSKIWYTGEYRKGGYFLVLEFLSLSPIWEKFPTKSFF